MSLIVLSKDSDLTTVIHILIKTIRKSFCAKLPTCPPPHNTPMYLDEPERCHLEQRKVRSENAKPCRQGKKSEHIFTEELKRISFPKSLFVILLEWVNDL